MRAEAEAFLEGVIWSLEHPDAIFEQVLAEANKRWPPFPEPTPAEIELGKRRTFSE